MINYCFYPIFLTNNHWKNIFQREIRFQNKNLQGSKTPKKCVFFSFITKIFACRIHRQHVCLRHRQKGNVIYLDKLPTSTPYETPPQRRQQRSQPLIEAKTEESSCKGLAKETNESYKSHLDASNSYQE